MARAKTSGRSGNIPFLPTQNPHHTGYGRKKMKEDMHGMSATPTTELSDDDFIFAISERSRRARATADWSPLPVDKHPKSSQRKPHPARASRKR